MLKIKKWIKTAFFAGSLCTISAWPLVAVSVAVAVPLPAYADTAQDSLFHQAISIQTQSSYSRLLVSLEPSFKPQVSQSAQGFQVVIPQATLVDLGIPFGMEAALQEYVSKLKDSRISKINLKEEDRGLKITGQYQFPQGAQALADPQMEHFEFRQNEKGKWVADFWYKKGPTLAESQALSRTKKIQKERAEQVAFEKKEAERKAAREKRILEAKNALLFCEQPFDRDNTVFIKYKPEHPLVNFSAYFPDKVPDHRFEYTTPKAKGEESDMVRLAIKLSQENKHALAIKTVEFLEKEYPKSKYLPEMLFLKASSLYRLDLVDQGKKNLSDVAKNNRGSEVGLQASAFLAIQSFNKSEWLAAVDGFMNIKREYPKHSLIWLFRYALADALYEIREADQSVAEYDWVSKNAPQIKIKSAAAFKIGDVYFVRNQYAVALQKYSQALQTFKDEVNAYPQVLLNLAESIFQLGEYSRAESYLIKYQSIARAQPSAWKAALRLAEIRALHQKMEGSVEKIFIETINQYPMTLGAVIARLRLLPCGQHGGFDVAGMERFINSSEVKNVEQSPDLMASTFKELVGLTEVRAYLSFGQDQKAIEKGLVHLRSNPTIEVRRLIEKAMVGGIKRLLANELDQNNFFGAMSVYEKYGDYLPMPSHDPHADDLRLKLGKMAAEKGLRTFAMKLIEPYQKANEVEQRELSAAIQRSFSLEGIQDYEERTMAQIKAIWNSADFDVQKQESAQELLTKMVNIRDQSPYAFTRDLIKALYLKETKSNDQAYALLGQMLQSPAFKALAPLEKVQVYSLHAEIAKSLNLDQAELASLKEARIERQKNDSSKTNGQELKYRHLKLAPSLGALYASEGELLEKLGKNKDAVALYSNAVENGIGGNRVLFAHARAVLLEGGRNSQLTASHSLEKIQQSQDDDVWKKLAKDKLNEIAKEGRHDDKRKP